MDCGLSDRSICSSPKENVEEPKVQRKITAKYINQSSYVLVILNQILDGEKAN
jgi:hypothetical protein